METAETENSNCKLSLDTVPEEKTESDHSGHVEQDADQSDNMETAETENSNCKLPSDKVPEEKTESDNSGHVEQDADQSYDMKTADTENSNCKLPSDTVPEEKTESDNTDHPTDNFGHVEQDADQSDDMETADTENSNCKLPSDTVPEEETESDNSGHVEQDADQSDDMKTAETENFNCKLPSDTVPEEKSESENTDHPTYNSGHADQSDDMETADTENSNCKLPSDTVPEEKTESENTDHPTDNSGHVEQDADQSDDMETADTENSNCKRQSDTELDTGSSDDEDCDISDCDPTYIPEKETSESEDIDHLTDNSDHIGESTIIIQNTSDEDEIVANSDSEPSSDVYPMLTKSKPEVSEVNDKDLSDDSDICITHDERAIARDIKNREVFVTLVQKSTFTKTGKRKKSNRVYNSRHPCLFCKKIVTNFSHHILAKKHQEEDVVKELLEEKEQVRKKHLTKLRLKAAHNHNIDVLKKKKGEIFLLRRTSGKQNNEESSDENDDDQPEHACDTIDISKYGPCPQCFGWVTLNSINRHVGSCVIKKSPSTKGALILQSNILCGKITEAASASLIKEVFPIMQLDKISETAKNDSLIVNLGNQWMMKNRGNLIMRKYYTSSIIRLAARMKLALHSLDKSEEDLDYYLKPSKFEIVVKASLQCCKQDGMDEEDLQAPSNCIKLGHDLRRMISAKLAKSIIDDNEPRKKEAEDFLKLMQMEWGLRVTQLGRQLLRERAFNKEIKLPQPNDVKRLANYLQKEITDLNLNDHSYPNYRRVAILSLARVTLFNRRRCHEVQAMKISSFSSRKKGIDEITLEMRGELTPFETQLLERQEVVVIRGKTGKGVPVILPSDVKKTLQFLADPDIREKAGIQPSNLYLFANRQIGVFRAYDAIRSISREGEAGLEMPELVRTSNMRKYMATMIQALDTTEAERQWVVDHLGHTMDIHRVHYRQTSDLLERVDVAKILLIQDMGLVGKYRGKKLQDIQLDDIMENDRVQEKTTNSSKSDAEKDDTSSNVPVDNDPTDASIDETYIPEIPSSDEEDEDNEPKPKRRKVKQAVRKQWSGDEVKEIEALFKDAFKKDACPGQKQIEKMMKISKEKSGFIHLRARDTIKKKISNMLIKRRKLSK